MAMMGDLDAVDRAAGRLTPGGRLGAFARMVWARTCGSAPSALLFGAALAFILPMLVVLNFSVRAIGFGEKATATLIVFAIGSGIGGVITWWLADLVGHAMARRQRFALMVMVMSIVVTGTIAFVYFLQFRSYFAEEHADTLSLMWLAQMLFTGAGAVFVFATVGVRLLLPLGLVVIFIAAWIFAVRKP